MNSSLRLSLLLACSPLLVCGLQIVFSRLIVNTARYVVFVASVVVGQVLMALAVWWLVVRYSAMTPHELMWASVYCLVIYNTLSYCYFHVFNLSETARRIRILNEIDKARQLRASDIASMYDVEDMIETRLERLVEMQQIKQSNGRYTLDRRLLYVAAKVIAGWRDFLGFPSLTAVSYKSGPSG